MRPIYLRCAVSVAAIAFAVATAMTLIWPLRSEVSDSIVNDLLFDGSSRKPIRSVVDQHDWDTVCYIGSYSRPSAALSRHLGKDMRHFRYEPDIYWIGEDANALAFINSANTIVYVSKILRKDIRNIVGPRCLNVAEAEFIVERRVAHDRRFLELHLS